MPDCAVLSVPTRNPETQLAGAERMRAQCLPRAIGSKENPARARVHLVGTGQCCRTQGRRLILIDRSGHRTDAVKRERTDTDIRAVGREPADVEDVAVL